MNPRDRLIFAMDVPTIGEAVGFAQLLNPYVGMFKIGLELWTAQGRRALENILEVSPSAKFMLDLKLHDIPTTVERAAWVIRKLSDYCGGCIKLVTAHVGDDGGSVRGAVQGLAGSAQVVGISVLTSVGAPDGLLFTSRMNKALKAGAAGVVCPGFVLPLLRKTFGGDPLLVTPGVRLLDHSFQNSIHDHDHVVTPGSAFRDGASYIVVGRPIRDAPRAIEAAKRICDEIAEAESLCTDTGL